jgi:hypothetical protein
VDRSPISSVCRLAEVKPKYPTLFICRSCLFPLSGGLSGKKGSVSEDDTKLQEIVLLLKDLTSSAPSTCADFHVQVSVNRSISAVGLEEPLSVRLSQ